MGNVVLGYHFPALAQLNEKFKIVACMDIDSEKESNCPVSAKFATNLKDVTECDADIFVVATPPVSHYKIAKNLLENGKTVLLEKPATKI